MERGQVRDAQAAAVLAVPVGREDAERQPQVVDLAVIDRTAVVGGVEEIGDPCGGVATRDRRAGHPREVQRAAAGDWAAVVELLGQRVELLVRDRLHGRVIGHDSQGPLRSLPPLCLYPEGPQPSPARTGSQIRGPQPAMSAATRNTSTSVAAASRPWSPTIGVGKCCSAAVGPPLPVAPDPPAVANAGSRERCRSHTASMLNPSTATTASSPNATQARARLSLAR